MRRAGQLIPFSRFHKRVLFIGESCKTDGARFSGYPTELQERVRLLSEFAPLLNRHLELIETALSVCQVSDHRKQVVEKHVDLRSLMSTAVDNSTSEETLNEFGVELVTHVRHLERTVFENLQESATEKELNQIRWLAKHAGFYEMHQL